MRSVLRFIAPSSENIELRRALVRRLLHAGVYPPARALVCVEVHAHDRWTAEGDRHRTPARRWTAGSRRRWKRAVPLTAGSLGPARPARHRGKMKRARAVDRGAGVDA